ncbi:MAG TPA: choice-of-anchor D domain-containing protein [Gemmatimonadaceae bacterium]|nr:choice-of-anchor D domain-containing protein [Gemmatimonadaceae bacterium]
MTISPDSSNVFVGDSTQLVVVNAPGFVTWSSSDSTIANVIHGVVHGIGSGSVTVNAMAGTSVAKATINVSQPPQIALSTTGITFEAAAGASPPPAQTLGVANSGSGPLQNLSVGLVTYSPGASGWLTATLPANASAPATLTVQPSTTILTPGTYSATVPVTSPQATNSPRSLTVTYVVDPASVLQLSRSSVPITAQTNGSLPSTQTVTITNTGGGTIGGIAPGTITYSAGATGWLAASVTSATTPATMTLTVLSTALSIGTYSATVPVTSTTTGVTPLNITVTYSVTAAPPPPTISLSANSVNFNATSGGSVPASQQITVTNSGSGTLNGLTAPVSYTSGSGWLTATLGSATAPATLTLTPNSVLAVGTYSATVAVTSASAANSPQNITVTYTVTQAPVISLSGTTANFLSQKANSDPANQQIAVSNSGGGSLTGLSATVNYSGSTTGWLAATVASAAPLSPSSTPLTLQVTTGTITPGTYSATVTIASTVPGVTSKNVTVTFERQATMTNDVEPTVLSGNCAGCHSGATPPDGVDFTSAASAQATLVNVAPSISTAYTYRVAPGDSTNSYLSHQLAGQTTENMPFSCSGGTGCLSSALQHLVNTWIQQGAAQ